MGSQKGEGIGQIYKTPVMQTEGNYTDPGDSNNGQCPYCPSSQHLSIVQAHLYNYYSSSQNYYYTKDINQIVEEAMTAANVRFEDDQYYDDDDEFMKREYQESEYQNKIININQYYYYHRDAPRIFHSGIQKPYNKWQDRKKSMLYRKLKKMLNEPESQSQTPQQYNADPYQSPHLLSHMLMDISDYNPYSKNYYLRVKARKEAARKQPTQTTKIIYEELKKVLADYSSLSDLSIHSNSSPKRTTKPEEPYKPLRQPKSLVRTKYDFKKKKVTIESKQDQPTTKLTQRQTRATMLGFRKSEQQIIIKHDAVPRKSLPILSLTPVKETKLQSPNKTKSTSLKNVRIRMHKNEPLTLRKPSPVKTRKNDSTRQFNDDKIITERVESYKSQQIPTRTVSKILLTPAMSKALASLQSTQKLPSTNLGNIVISEQTLNKILLRRYQGK